MENKQCKLFNVKDILTITGQAVHNVVANKGNLEIGKEVCKSDELDKDGYKGFNQEQLMLIECPKGFVVCCSEGVGSTVSIGDTFEIDIAVDHHNGSIPFYPTGVLKVDPKKVMEANIPSTEVTLTDHIRKFGSRLESNFNIMVKAVVELGGNREEFTR